MSYKLGSEKHQQPKFKEFWNFCHVGRGSDETYPLVWQRYSSGVRFVARLYAGEKLSRPVCIPIAEQLKLLFGVRPLGV